MHSGEQIPKVSTSTLLSKALLEMSQKGLGMTTVLDDDGVLQGLFTDGDLRRTLDHSIDIHTTNIADVMTKNCRTASPGMLAAEVLGIMDKYKINSMAVVDDSNKPVGAVHLHDLLKAGIA